VKVAYCAPLPPARTGVADYAAALLTALRRHGSVEPHARHADVALYHLGNNPLHREIYRRALAEPGVVVLHDAVLHHFFLGALGRDAYIEEFVYNYGEWQRALAEEMWRARASSGFDRRYFEYPMLKRIAERSRAVVVHNPAAARMVRQHSPVATVIEIPHLFAPPELPPAAAVVRMRQSLGVPAHEFLFGVFGYLRESKRLFAVLRAFDRLRQARPHACANARLLVAGPFVSSDLARAVGPRLRGARNRALALSPRARLLARRAGGGRLHQPAIPGRRRNLRHRHPAHGSLQARPAHRRRGEFPLPPNRVPAHRSRPGGRRLVGAQHVSANIDERMCG
jgi:glycosyltransferase involved in cell wall biosynthesis